MALQENVRKVLELAARCTLESEVPREYEDAAHYCIASGWAWIQPVCAVCWDSDWGLPGRLFDRPTVLFPYSEDKALESKLLACSRNRLLLKPEGEKVLATDRIGANEASENVEQRDKSGRPKKGSKPGRPRKAEGASKDHLIEAALAKHHGYEPGATVANREPASAGMLARLAGTTTPTVIRFMKKQLGEPWREKYRAACARNEMGMKLALWQRELPDHVERSFLDAARDGRPEE